MADSSDDQPIELEDGAVERAVGGKATLTMEPSTPTRPKGGGIADPDEGGE